MQRLEELINRLNRLKEELVLLNQYYEKEGLPKGRNYQKKNSYIEQAQNQTLGQIMDYGKITIHSIMFSLNNKIFNIELPLSESESRLYLETFYPNHITLEIRKYQTGVIRVI